MVPCAGADEIIVLDDPGGNIADHQATIPPAPAFAGDTATLQFEAPLRLQANGRRATADEYNPRRLLTALIRRIALIAEFHGDGPLTLDFKSLAAQADALASEKLSLIHISEPTRPY